MTNERIAELRATWQRYGLDHKVGIKKREFLEVLDTLSKPVEHCPECVRLQAMFDAAVEKIERLQAALTRDNRQHGITNVRQMAAIWAQQDAALDTVSKVTSSE